MGTSRLLTKSQSRPRKSEARKAKRVRTQKRRLVESGMDETALRAMNASEIRATLRQVARTKPTANAMP